MAGDPRRLAFYGLPGHVESAAPLRREVADGADLGLGAVLLSERLNVKESAALCGYAAALAGPDMEVVAGLTVPHTRHPQELAAYGATMTYLAEGGFTLGLGRGVDHNWDTWGMPRPGMAMLEDVAGVLRRLWAGESVVGHDGPLGRFPGTLSLGMELPRQPRLGLGALGPKTQALAGRCYDDLLLHSHWTAEGTRRSVERVRRAAEEAGRDPAHVRVWAMLVTACDQPEEVVLQKVVRRMTTYMQWPGYGELIVDANGWDRAVLDRLRTHPLLDGRMADVTAFTTDELLQIRELYPDEWLREGAAVGSPEHCAAMAQAQLDAGADRVVLHGSAPAEVASLVEAFTAA